MGDSSAIPHTLLQSIRNGEAILFLGAGASRGALHPQALSIPTGSELRDMLADKFLGGQCKDRSLEDVANFVQNESGRPQLEKFVAEVLRPFRPSSAHQLLPMFRWRAIFTVNYDLLVESAYDAASAPLQALITFHRDQNSIDRDLQGTPNSVGYFKLHGCINRIYASDAPLIRQLSP